MRYNRLYKDNHFLTPTTYTQDLSEYLEGLTYEDIPADVLERAKMILLHTIGVSLPARDSEVSVKARQMAREANGGSRGPVTVWGSGEKMSALNAALALGTMADALDWEDCSWTGAPSAGIVPCAWLAAEEHHKSGKELLTAIVGAYETYQRIAMAVQPSDERWRSKGWGLTSWQIFGCIFSVSKLYGLDARKINQAIGLGCECSTMPTAYHAVTMSDFSHFEYGYRARDGFLIAKAAEKGIHNNRDTLDVPRLYTGVICGDSARDGNGDALERAGEADVTWLTRDLGSRYLIMNTLLKRWPANLWLQTPLEIVSNLVQENQLTPDSIEEILLDPPIANRMFVPDEGFTSVTHAQFSAPYVLAAMLYQPTPGACWYTPERMKDPKVLALAKRVKAGPSQADSPIDGFHQFRSGSYPMKTVTIKRTDGRTFSAKMDRHPGHPDYMMSWETLKERFRMQASPVLPGNRLETLLETLCSIEQIEDIASVCNLLS